MENETFKFPILEDAEKVGPCPHCGGTEIVYVIRTNACFIVDLEKKVVREDEELFAPLLSTIMTCLKCQAELNDIPNENEHLIIS